MFLHKSPDLVDAETGKKLQGLVTRSWLRCLYGSCAFLIVNRRPPGWATRSQSRWRMRRTCGSTRVARDSTWSGRNRQTSQFLRNYARWTFLTPYFLRLILCGLFLWSRCSWDLLQLLFVGWEYEWQHPKGITVGQLWSLGVDTY